MGRGILLWLLGVPIPKDKRRRIRRLPLLSPQRPAPRHSGQARIILMIPARAGSATSSLPSHCSVESSDLPVAIGRITQSSKESSFLAGMRSGEARPALSGTFPPW